jgi:type II secretory pathway pseudopilin PulG
MKNQRGFSLLTVMLLVAMVTISSLVVIELVMGDHDIQGMERRTREAREAAEGGTMELINEELIADVLPDLSEDDLTSVAKPTSDNVFSSIRADGSRLEYEGTVALIRISPLLESSHSRVRAVVYELEVTGESSNHTVVTQTQIYKMAAASPGLVQAPRHAH